MLTTFLRDSKIQPYEVEEDGLDCHCQVSTDEEGKVTRIFFVRRVPDHPHEHKKADTTIE